jgi:hypothetical protein
MIRSALGRSHHQLSPQKVSSDQKGENREKEGGKSKALLLLIHFLPKA